MILFAVVLVSIMLSITLSVSNIALKEVKFATSSRDTNNAFFAADTGIECALMNDKSIPGSVFPWPGTGNVTVVCNGSNITATRTTPSANVTRYSFVVTSLGSNNLSCASVTIDKNGTNNPVIATTITSKGYNVYNTSVNPPCSSFSSNTVERQIETRY